MLGDRRLEPVPDWLMRDVLGPVLSDLQRPRPVEIELGVERRGEGGVVWFSERGGSGAAGLGVPDSSWTSALAPAWTLEVAPPAVGVCVG